MKICKSERLNGREIIVCIDKDEARQAWEDYPDNRGGIYIASEIEVMRGKENPRIELVQDVKDIFLGSVVEKVEE